MVDGGDDDDTIAVTNAAERTTIEGGSGADSINIGVVSQGYVQAGVGDDTIKVTDSGVTSASLKAGVGNDLMSLSGGITDGSLFGGTGNDSFDFTGGRVTGLVDTGTGADSVLLGTVGADTVTITGALTSTTLKAGAGADSLVISANLSAASLEGGSGADTLNFTAGSASILGTASRAVRVQITSASTVQMMLSLILLLTI